MKVAILISGQPRNYLQGYENLKKAYLDRYDCDVFFHTWEGGHFEASHFNPNEPKRIYEPKGDYIGDLIQLYKPTGMITEPQRVFDDTGVVDPIWRQPLQHSASMWYSVMKAYSCFDSGYQYLKSEENRYDVFIRTRFDLQYEESTLELENLDMSKLHIWEWKTDERVRHRGYYDVFAIGNEGNIRMYSSLFPRLNWYLNYDESYRKFLSGGWPGQDSGLRNEYLLKWHLLNCGVEMEIHPTMIDGADGHILR